MKCIEFNVFHSSQLAITLKNKNESKNCELATLKHAQFFNDWNVMGWAVDWAPL